MSSSTRLPISARKNSRRKTFCETPASFVVRLTDFAWIHWFKNQSIAYSIRLIGRLIHWFIDWSFDRLIRLIDWLVEFLIDRSIDWLLIPLIDCLIDCLSFWLIVRLIDWLIGLLYCVFVFRFGAVSIRQQDNLLRSPLPAWARSLVLSVLYDSPTRQGPHWVHRTGKLRGGND